MSFATSRMSPQGYEVACRAARGMTNQQIADDLGMALQTVKNHLWESYRRLGISSRQELSEAMQRVEK